jgi:segregation and condensation protein B
VTEETPLFEAVAPEGTGPAEDRIEPALEAILMVVDEPVAVGLLAQTLGCPPAQVTTALEGLAAEYTAAGRGFELRRAAGGWRLYTRTEYAPHVERFVLEGQQARLTQAALETLAVIAYKQPVTRSSVAAIRGVSVDGVIRTLLSRGLIEECGTDPETGGYQFQTTPLFLEKLGLNSLDELPALAPLLPGMDALDDVIATS